MFNHALTLACTTRKRKGFVLVSDIGTQAVSPREATQTNQDATEGESISENQIFSENQSIQTDPSLFSAPETHTSSPMQENPATSLTQEDEWSEGDIS